MLRSIALGCGVLLATAGFATTGLASSDKGVSKTKGYKNFTKKFCNASRKSQHIFIVPTAVFMDNKTVTCDDGESKLRTTEPADDPGHIVFNIDPPSGSANSFDCDGKADKDMSPVAINCLPVSQESADHKKE